MKVQLQMSNNLICKYNDAAQHDHVAIPVQMKWYHNNEQYKNNYKQKCATMFASDSVGAWIMFVFVLNRCKHTYTNTSKAVDYYVQYSDIGNDMAQQDTGGVYRPWKNKAAYGWTCMGATCKHFDRYKHEYVYDWQNKVVSDKTGNEQTEIEKYQV